MCAILPVWHLSSLITLHQRPIQAIAHGLHLSDPRNRNHKSLAIANHNFEVASFSRRNRSEIAVLEVCSESQWFFWVAIVVASDLRFEVAAIRVTKVFTSPVENSWRYALFASFANSSSREAALYFADVRIAASRSSFLTSSKPSKCFAISVSVCFGLRSISS